MTRSPVALDARVALVAAGYDDLTVEPEGPTPFLWVLARTKNQ
jgi:hypothetical protein